jgi:hypothetical protein
MLSKNRCARRDPDSYRDVAHAAFKLLQLNGKTAFYLHQSLINRLCHCLRHRSHV